MLRRTMLTLVSVLGVLGALSSIGLTASTAQAAAASALGGSQTARVSIGGFLVPVGANLALELERDNPCGCLCDPVLILAWSLSDSTGEPVRRVEYDDPPKMEAWLAEVPLCNSAGSALDLGDYTIEVESTAGVFAAHVRVASDVPQGRFQVSASVCGLTLRVYRLVTEEDADSIFDLRVGDRLIVVLPGNPTTGYSWTSTLLYEYALLIPIGEPEFRPTGSSTGMVGAGGLFFFRYEARDEGIQWFRFLYARPWESSDSDLELAFQVNVR